jgi:hypothetical protein
MNKDDASNYIPDVHAPPRPGFIVYPNKYKPLAGHTGKPSHIEPYLLFDPEVAYEAPPGSSGILTMKDYKRYLAQLNGKRESPKQVFTVMKQLSSKKLILDDDDESATGGSDVIALSAFNQDDDFVPSHLPPDSSSSRPSSARLEPLHHEPQSPTHEDRPSTTGSVGGASRLRREGSQSDSISSTIKRQGSGVLQAHTSRAGPEFFLSKKAVSKSYKQFILSFSKDGIDGEEHISRNNSHCSMSSLYGDDCGDKQKAVKSPVMRKKKLNKSHSTTDGKKSELKRSPSSSSSLGNRQDKGGAESMSKSVSVDDDLSRSDEKSGSQSKQSKQQDNKECEKSHKKGQDQPDETSVLEDVDADAKADCKAESKSEGKDQFDDKINVQTSCSKDEDADLSIYQDDDDFESCTSQKIADNDDAKLVEGMMSPLTMADHNYTEHDDDGTLTYDTNILDSNDHQAVVSRSSSLGMKSKEEEEEGEREGEGAMPQGLDTHSSVLLSKHSPEKEKKMPPDPNQEDEDDAFEKEQYGYEDEDFEPMSASNSPAKQPLQSKSKEETEEVVSVLNKGHNSDVYDLSDED